ncbi:hypothetical protein ES319_D08G250800v1 [Gossypium barbadense]|uniref:BHLH domain-containing protein n=2 Tax=Gossypium TaxID=3633 RepID=A0A5J5QIL3_GOSBA|nr:hypothetical protein ES319_D08G250800v1 [Gossypium barbadense]PPD89177.1 hypothetical protein GOBAR_DD13899 [Gossypium barbadense]TYG58949.1 hypothetical protein ES288_D08G262800v1 [Gossypium darwinii]
MALEAVIFQQDLLGYNSNWSHDFGLGKPESKDSFGCFPDNQTPEINHFVHGDYWVSTTPTSSMAAPVPYHHQLQHHCPNSSSDAANVNGLSSSGDPFYASTTPRPKRRRFKARKNKQEIENQRMTHIAVERNRRKQMNDYLSVLRSLMPESYVQRGDQASIIGGAINFVKELEHRLQRLSTEKEVKERSSLTNGGRRSCSSVFDEFFTFPQYSTSSKQGDRKDSISMNDQSTVETQSAIADIEVTMVERHVNLRIRSKKRPAQLLKVVSGLNCMRLSILHLNVTTLDQTVLYSLSVKVEEDCKLTSVDDIATAVNQLLGSIEDALLTRNFP